MLIEQLHCLPQRVDELYAFAHKYNKPASFQVYEARFAFSSHG
jgi:hypothetical protein